MLSIRKATHDDMEIYFKWANDPVVRENAFTAEEISWETHVDWYTKKLNDKNSYLYIIEEEYKPMGQVRFDVDSVAGKAEIGYSVDADHRGSGFGGKLIDKGIIEFQNDNKNISYLIAKVKEKNIASGKIFVNNGFEIVEKYGNDSFDVVIFEKKMK